MGLLLCSTNDLFRCCHTSGASLLSSRALIVLFASSFAPVSLLDAESF